MGTLTVNGLKTNFQKLPGSATATDTVVFIHGLGTDSLASFYLTLAPPLASAGIEVVSYDLRGHGKTDRPDTGYTIKDFLADLDDLLRQLEIDRPVHLVGNSFGGTLAYSYAATYPERVRSIVCIESEPPTEEWSEKMQEVLRNTVEFLREEESYAWIEANFGAHHRRLSQMAAKRIHSTAMPQEVPLGPLLSMEEIAAISCPVLSLFGSDGFHAENLDELTDLLPAGEKHVFEAQGHSVLVERHREIRGILLDWIARHGNGAQ